MERRDLLKRVGTGATALSGLAGNVTASDESDVAEFKRDVLEAFAIGRERGDDAMEDYFDSSGYPHTSIEAFESFSLGSSDPTQGNTENAGGVSTQSIANPQGGGIRVRMGVAEHYLGYLAAYLRVEYQFMSVCDGIQWQRVSFGTAPDDAAGIMWNSRQNEYFELADGGGESAIIANDYDVRWDRDFHSPSIGRTGFRYDDTSVWQNWARRAYDTPCNYSRGLPLVASVDAGVCGVILDPVGDWNRDRRVVRGAYTHAHGTIALAPSISFSYSGPSLSFGPSYRITDHKIVTNDEGDDLQVYQSEL